MNMVNALTAKIIYRDLVFDSYFITYYTVKIKNYHLGHNILELYNVLVEIRLTKSKTKRDIKYSKLGIQAASRVAKRLKT